MAFQNRYRAALLTLVLLPAALVAAQAQPGRRAAAPPTPARQRQQFGKVGIVYDTAEIVTDRRRSGVFLDLRGAGGRDAVMTSARFDLAAPRIVVSGTERLLNTGTASGGVKIELREGQRRTSITAPEAVYTGATPQKPAHINLKGRVRYRMTGPEMDPGDPLTGEAEGGYIEFTDPDTTTLRLGKGRVSGTPLEERPPAPAAPGAGTAARPAAGGAKP